MPDLFPDVPLENQIKAVEREIALREKVYPDFVARKRLSQDRAAYEIRAMKSVLASLLRLRGVVP